MTDSQEDFPKDTDDHRVSYSKCNNEHCEAHASFGAHWHRIVYKEDVTNFWHTLEEETIVSHVEIEDDDSPPRSEEEKAYWLQHWQDYAEYCAQHP